MQMRVSALLAVTVLLVLSTACRDSVPPHQDASGYQLVQTPPGSQERLTLGKAEPIAGTTVFRVDLFVNREAGFSSDGKGSYFETRNILFVDPSEKTARWLLPD